VAAHEIVLSRKNFPAFANSSVDRQGQDPHRRGPRLNGPTKRGLSGETPGLIAS
jgi:hypothetical protein